MWLKIRNKIYLTDDNTFPDSDRTELEQLIERLVTKGLWIDGFESNKVNAMYCNNDIKDLTIECYGAHKYLKDMLIQCCTHYNEPVPSFLNPKFKKLEPLDFEEELVFQLDHSGRGRNRFPSKPILEFNQKPAAEDEKLLQARLEQQIRENKITIFTESNSLDIKYLSYLVTHTTPETYKDIYKHCKSMRNCLRTQVLFSYLDLVVPQGNLDGIWNILFLADYLEYRTPTKNAPYNNLLLDFQSAGEQLLWRAIRVGNFHLALHLIQAAKQQNLNWVAQSDYDDLCRSCLNKNSDGAVEFFKLVLDNNNLLQAENDDRLVFNWKKYLRYDENTNLKIIEINFDKFLYMLQNPKRITPQPDENLYLLILKASRTFIPEQNKNLYSVLEAKFFNYCIENNISFPGLEKPLQEYIDSLSKLFSTNATAALMAPNKSELSKLVSAKVYEQILAAAEEGLILRSQPPKIKLPRP